MGTLHLMGISTLAQSSGVGSIVTEDLFNAIFPNKNPFYAHDSFISAAGTFSMFGTTGDSDTQKRDIAAFFAHSYHETAGLQYINEVEQGKFFCDASSTQYPCVPGKRYFGRGPLQLTWNFNYGPAGEAIGQDLLSNPDLVGQDPVVSFQSALWFWTTPQPPEPSCEQVMDGGYQPTADDTAAGRVAGFGLTINIINGGIECGSRATGTAKAADRVTQYQNICGILSDDPGSNLDCSSMQPY